MFMLQEVRLSELQQLKVAKLLKEEGWQSFMGKPAICLGTSKKEASSDNWARGGVAIEVPCENPATTIQSTENTFVLPGEGRWEEVSVACGGGRERISAASMYG